MTRTKCTRRCAWCGTESRSGSDAAWSLGLQVCDYCLVGFIVLASDLLLDVEGTDAPRR